MSNATLPFTYRPAFTFYTARYMEIHNVPATTATVSCISLQVTQPARTSVLQSHDRL